MAEVEAVLEPFPSSPGEGEDGFQPRPRSETDPSSTIASTSFPSSPDFQRKKEDPPLKAGFLRKEGKNRKNWKKRWFILTSESISYYPDQKSKNPLKVILLADILQVKINQDRLEANLFEITSISRPFYICANSEEEMEEWMFAIKYAIETLEMRRSETCESRDSGRFRSISVKNHSDSATSCSSAATRTSKASIDMKQIVKSGYLVKQGDAVKNWKKRWFVLRNGNLSYYKDKEDPKPIRVLQLQDCLHVKPSEKERKNCFQYITTERIFYICAETQDELGDWMEKISMAVTAAKSAGASLSTFGSESTELGESSESEDGETKSVSDQIPPEEILKCGYLTKQGITIKSWKKRWFICTKNSLAYYPTEKSKEAIKMLDLRRCTAALESSLERSPHGIEIVFPERTFYVICEGKEERDDWLKTLRAAVARVF